MAFDTSIHLLKDIRVVIVALFVLVSGCESGSLAGDDPSILAIRGVTLIDGTARPPRPDVTIVVEGNRIARIGETASMTLPPSAHVVEARGKYVIPGLWDMHVHLSKTKEQAFPMLIANGVTSVRDMGGDIEELSTWRDRIERREILGPRILFAGPMFEAPGTLDRMSGSRSRERFDVTRVPVPDTSSAKALVDSVVALGVDFIKIRESVSNAAYAAVVRAAQNRGLDVAGHAPFSMDPVEGASLGMVTFEHGSYPYPLDDDPDERDRILSAFLENGVAVVPTLVAWETNLMDRDSVMALVRDSLGRRDRRRPLISKFLAHEWQVDIDDQTRKDDATLAGWKGFYRRHAADLSAMHQAGIPILAGSDVAGPAIYPGYSLHDELELLVRLVGLSPKEAIRSATALPARIMGLEADVGTIEQGKRADLVILSADPIADISNTRRIAAVIRDGRLLDSGAIKRLLGGLSPMTEGEIELLQQRTSAD